MSIHFHARFRVVYGIVNAGYRVASLALLRDGAVHEFRRWLARREQVAEMLRRKIGPLGIFADERRRLSVDFLPSMFVGRRLVLKLLFISGRLSGTVSCRKG